LLEIALGTCDAAQDGFAALARAESQLR